MKQDTVITSKCTKTLRSRRREYQHLADCLNSQQPCPSGVRHADSSQKVSLSSLTSSVMYSPVVRIASTTTSTTPNDSHTMTMAFRGKRISKQRRVIHREMVVTRDIRQRIARRTTTACTDECDNRENEIGKTYSDEIHSDATVMEKKTNERRFAISILAGSMFFCNMHRVLTAVLALPLAERFGFNMVELGFLQSSFLWGYGLNQVPSGMAADAYGGVRLMLLGLCFWSLSTATVPFVSLLGAVGNSNRPQLIYLMASRCVMGMASAVALPSVSSCVSRKVDDNHRAGTLSLIYGAFNLGTVVGLVGIPMICLRLGWEATFSVVGGIGVAVSLFGAMAVRIYGRDIDTSPATSTTRRALKEKQIDSDSDSDSDSDKERGEGSSTIASQSAATEVETDTDDKERTTSIFQDISRLSKKNLIQVMGLMWSHSVIGWGFFVLLNWIPTYITKSLGQTSLSSTGALAALPWCCTVIASFIAGKFSDRLINKDGVPIVRARTICMLISTIGPGLALLLIAIISSSVLQYVPLISGAPSTPFIITCLSFALGCLAFSYSGFHSYIQDVSGGKAGALLAMTNTAGIIMGIVGNILSGYMMEMTGSFTVMFLLTGLMFLSSGIMWRGLMKGDALFV